jgi:hypothetical protein
MSILEVLHGGDRIPRPSSQFLVLHRNGENLHSCTAFLATSCLNFPSGTFLGTTTGCDRHFQFLMNLTSKDERRLQYHYLEHSILL